MTTLCDNDPLRQPRPFATMTLCNDRSLRRRSVRWTMDGWMAVKGDGKGGREEGRGRNKT
jgi:hypothetical protein